MSAQAKAHVTTLQLATVLKNSPSAMLHIDSVEDKLFTKKGAVFKTYGMAQDNYFHMSPRLIEGSNPQINRVSLPIKINTKTLQYPITSVIDNVQNNNDPLAFYATNPEQKIHQKTEILEQNNGLLTHTLFWAIALLSVIIIILVVVFVRRRRLAKELTRQHLLMRVVIDSIPDQVYFKTSSGKLAACNQAAAEFVGMPIEKIIGKSDTEVFGESRDLLLRKHVFSNVQNTERLVNQGVVSNPAGKKYTLEMIKAPVIDSSGKRLGAISVWRDLSERRRSEARIEALAFYDPLTKLANRAKTHDTIPCIITTHQFNHQYMAVAIFDLDNFAAINSIFGHKAGDCLLQTTGKRLKDGTPLGGFSARLSSDEFLILLPGLGSDKDMAHTKAKNALMKLHHDLSLPAAINANHVTPSTSVGAVLVGGDTTTAEEVLRRADLAMHNAKDTNRGSIEWFHTDMDEDLVERFDMEKALKHALLNNGFLLYIQPKIHSNSPGRHFEVLLRLQHPVHGIVNPGCFIDIAERTGLIVPIGAWVLEEAIKLLSEHPDLHLAVNVSVQQLLQDDFVDTLTNLLLRYNFDPSHLTLETTESLMIANFDLALSLLQNIRNLKVRLSIDDFGTGYSALIYLKQLPLDELKIDRTFIAGVPHEDKDTSLVEFIIATAHHLGLSVVAEGVERKEQEAWLRENGCECLQGYLYDKPQPVDHFLVFS